MYKPTLYTRVNGDLYTETAKIINDDTLLGSSTLTLATRC